MIAFTKCAKEYYKQNQEVKDVAGDLFYHLYEITQISIAPNQVLEFE